MKINELVVGSKVNITREDRLNYNVPVQVSEITDRVITFKYLHKNVLFLAFKTNDKLVDVTGKQILIVKEIKETIQ